MLLFAVVILTFVSVFSCAVQATFHEPACAAGRHALVHLFEWRWEDVAEECERFLGPYGYCGVQVSPPTENAVVTNPDRPWWERYQPVSYRLDTRSGDEHAFSDMVLRCHRVGVRIYVDVVINHMTGAGGWGNGTGGSPWSGEDLSYPAVPYSAWDFNGPDRCPSADGNVHDYNNKWEVRNCRLVSLVDLALDKGYVRGRVAGFLNHLISLGVAGFRVDAAKHMWPHDLTAVFGMLKNLRHDLFGQGQRPFIFQEVIDFGGEAIRAEEYLPTGRVTNFKYGRELAGVFHRKNAMKWLENWGEGWGMWNGNDVIVFIDNHDSQRGHGGGGQVLTHKHPRLYKLATAFMLAHPYGFPRIMSSFGFQSTEQGPPHDHQDGILPVVINDDLTCQGGWVCEHRWRQVYNMVAFRNVAGVSPMTHWWAGADYQIAFGRGSEAFIALNLEHYPLTATLQTGLPAGTYCDVISGNMADGDCTGGKVEVGADGWARFDVCHDCEDPVVAIHVGAKIGSMPKRTG